MSQSKPGWAKDSGLVREILNLVGDRDRATSETSSDREDSKAREAWETVLPRAVSEIILEPTVLSIHGEKSGSKSKGLTLRNSS